MPLKSFDELRAVDISAYVEQRDGFDYLNWAKCIDLLHKNGAEKVFFHPMTDDKGSSLFMSDREFKDKSGNTNKCYEVAVEIEIDDLKFVMRTPVMNGSNPVKDNSMSQQRVWNAQTRAFVKGVAIMTGLGFDLWAETETAENNTVSKEDDLSKHSIQRIKERTQMLYIAVLKTGKSTKDVADALSMSEDSVKAMFAQYDILDNFEKALSKI